MRVNKVVYYIRGCVLNVIQTEKPTDVQIGILVNSFYSFNEQTMVCNDCQKH